MKKNVYCYLLFSLLVAEVSNAGIVGGANPPVNIADTFFSIPEGPIEGILERGGISYAEGFEDPSGNTMITPLFVWDGTLIINPVAGDPLTLLPGTEAAGGDATENLYGISAKGRLPDMLAGCGPNAIGAVTLNCDEANGKGPGSVAMLFEEDTDAVKLGIIAPLGIEGPAADQYLILVHFYRRDGSLIDVLQVGFNDGIFRQATLDGSIKGTQFGKSEWGFSATDDDMIAGLLITNQTGAFGSTGTIKPEFGIKIDSVAWRRPDPAPQAQVVPLDVKPGSCPNPINTNFGGSISVAVLGTESFDVNTIDETTLLLDGVSPVAVHFEDVSTPYEGNGLGCTTDGPDGHMDLQLKFKVPDILEALGGLSPQELILTGELQDGTEIKGKDWVIYK